MRGGSMTSGEASPRGQGRVIGEAERPPSDVLQSRPATRPRGARRLLLRPNAQTAVPQARRVHGVSYGWRRRRGAATARVGPRGGGSASGQQRAARLPALTVGGRPRGIRHARPPAADTPTHGGG